MGRRESLKDALRPSLGDIPTVENFDSFVQSLHAIAITNAPLERGLVLTDRVSVISENQLYEHRWYSAVASVSRKFPKSF